MLSEEDKKNIDNFIDKIKQHSKDMKVENDFVRVFSKFEDSNFFLLSIIKVYNTVMSIKCKHAILNDLELDREIKPKDAEIALILLKEMKTF